MNNLTLIGDLRRIDGAVEDVVGTVSSCQCSYFITNTRYKITDRRAWMNPGLLAAIAPAVEFKSVLRALLEGARRVTLVALLRPVTRSGYDPSNAVSAERSDWLPNAAVRFTV